MQWSQNAYYPQPDNLQFYQDYPGSRPSLDGALATQQHIPQTPHTYAGNIQSVGGWWTAFGTGGFEGEPPLLEGTSFVPPMTILINPTPRARDQFLAYTCKVPHCPEPSPGRRCAYNGRCRHGWSHHLFVLLRDMSVVGESTADTMSIGTRPILSRSRVNPTLDIYTASAFLVPSQSTPS